MEDMKSLADKSKSDLYMSAQRARNALANAKKAGVRAVRKASMFAAMPAGAYGVGRLRGWADREGKKVTIGESEVSWALPAGAIVGAIGAFALTDASDEFAGDVLLGLGGGMVAGEAALAGHRHGIKPKE